ncbi:hypothetical protein D3C79_1074820 [compost metagenome]
MAAVPAINRQTGHYMIARFNCTDISTDRLDNARGLMAQHNRSRDRQHAVHDV